MDDPLDAFEAAAPSTSLQVSAIAWSDIGRKRHNNEDNFLFFDLQRRAAHAEKTAVTLDVEAPGLLLAVADGMGGHQAGQVASQLCVENLPKELLHKLDAQDGTHSATVALIQAVETTNRIIFEQAGQSPELHGMGTTLVAALVAGSDVVVALVGDSRAYLLSGGALTQLTTDQTVANYLLAAQPDVQIDERTGEMLVQAVGAQPEVEVVLTASEIETGDLLLLCSDGLYKVVSANEIVDLLQRPGSLQTKAEALVSRANLNGGPDNVTVILAEILHLAAG